MAGSGDTVSERGRGQPEKYKPEFVRVAKKMSELGAVDEEIAEAIGVSVRTLFRWKAKYPDFCQAIKTAKAPADDRVSMSLYHRAVGYSHPDSDIKVINGEIVITEITKHYPPDTTACIFWLTNRRPDLWRKNADNRDSDDEEKLSAIEIVRASRPSDASPAN